MVKIHGVDPIVMERIKERTRKEAIFKPEKTKVTAYKNDENKEKREQKYDQKSLQKAIAKLNKLLEEEKMLLRFQIIDRDARLKVQLLDISKNKVLSEFFPEKIYKIMENPQQYAGVVIDESV